jgi:hypothetical protein
VYPGEKGVQQVSKLPTREEAVANIVAAILAPGRKLGGILKDQAGKIAAILKTVEEKAKEKEAAAAPASAAPEAAPTAPPEAAPAAAPEAAPTAPPEAAPTAPPETAPTAPPEATPTA